MRAGATINRRSSRPTQSGFSTIELMIGLTVLVIAVLAHVSSVIGEHRLMNVQRVRAGALRVAHDVLDRLQADEDKPGLYARLLPRALHAQDPGTLGPDEVRLGDGRRAYPLDVYFPGYVPPAYCRAHLLIDVPRATPADPTDPRAHVLREDLAVTRFGLPADLDGSGTIDNVPRDDDYLVLPVVIYLRWKPDGEVAREIRLTAWLRGER